MPTDNELVMNVAIKNDEAIKQLQELEKQYNKLINEVEKSNRKLKDSTENAFETMFDKRKIEKKQKELISIIEATTKKQLSIIKGNAIEENRIIEKYAKDKMQITKQANKQITKVQRTDTAKDEQTPNALKTIENSISDRKQLEKNAWDKQQDDENIRNTELLQQLRQSLEDKRMTIEQYNTSVEDTEQVHGTKMRNIQASYHKAVGDEIINIRKQSANASSNLSITDMPSLEKELKTETIRYEGHLMELRKKYGDNAKLIEEAAKLNEANVSRIQHAEQIRQIEIADKAADKRSEIEIGLSKWLNEENIRRNANLVEGYEKEIYELKELYSEKLYLAQKNGIDTAPMQENFGDQLINIYRNNYGEISKMNLKNTDNVTPETDLSDLEKNLKSSYGVLNNEYNKLVNSLSDFDALIYSTSNSEEKNIETAVRMYQAKLKSIQLIEEEYKNIGENTDGSDVFVDKLNSRFKLAIDQTRALKSEISGFETGDAVSNLSPVNKDLKDIQNKYTPVNSNIDKQNTALNEQLAILKNTKGNEIAISNVEKQIFELNNLKLRSMEAQTIETEDYLKLKNKELDMALSEQNTVQSKRNQYIQERDALIQDTADIYNEKLKLSGENEEKKLAITEEYEQRKIEIQEQYLEKSRQLYIDTANSLMSDIQSAYTTGKGIYSSVSTLADSNSRSSDKLSVVGDLTKNIPVVGDALSGVIGDVAGSWRKKEEKAIADMKQKEADIAERQKNIEEAINELIRKREQLINNMIEFNIDGMKNLNEQYQYYSDIEARRLENMNDTIGLLSNYSKALSDTNDTKAIDQFGDVIDKGEEVSQASIDITNQLMRDFADVVRYSNEELINMYDEYAEKKANAIAQGDEELAKAYDIALEGINRELERRKKVIELDKERIEVQNKIFELELEMGKASVEGYKIQLQAREAFKKTQDWLTMSKEEQLEYDKRTTEMVQKQSEMTYNISRNQAIINGMREDSVESMEMELQHLQSQLDDLDNLNISYEEQLELKVKIKQLEEDIAKKTYDDQLKEIEHRKNVGEYDMKEAEYGKDKLDVLVKYLSYLKSVGASDKDIWDVEEQIYELKKAQTEELMKQNGLIDDQLTMLLKMRQQAIEEARKTGQYADTSGIEQQIIEKMKELGASDEEINKMLASFNLPMYATGGYTGNKMGIVHAGEYVIPANKVKKISEFVDDLSKDILYEKIQNMQREYINGLQYAMSDSVTRISNAKMSLERAKAQAVTYNYYTNYNAPLIDDRGDINIAGKDLDDIEKQLKPVFRKLITSAVREMGGDLRQWRK